MTLRVGIISAAWGAFAHLPAWRAIPGVEVTAICTSREETARAAADRLGIARPFHDFRAMCADPDLDIIDCGTRPVLRREMVLAALANGKHVYNASPHAPDWAAAKEIDRAWRASGRVGIVDAFAQWLPAHRQMKALIEDGYLGRPLGGTCRFNISLFNQPSKRFPYNWFAQGGQGVTAVRNNGSHLVYVLLDLFGPVTALVADDTQILHEWVFDDGDRIVPETTDYANVILKFASGLTLPMQISWSMALHDGWAIDVFGERGRLAATSPTFPTARDCILRGGQLGGGMEPIALPDAFRHGPGIALDWDSEPQPSFPMALSMQAMVVAIHGGLAASPNFARALEIERLQEAIRLSSDERRWISLADIV
ncbi:Gfo/Idh/MocA family oxidoreductase [Sphingomonas ginsenosidivorax]|uniref:Gfo/Idh/MocA family oxidoreductase n=1 Tax=Sphingomonas ginsenosidivorax TaxID=862135 RepID=A0A5C6UDH5_9SPHN|nr:Gfo/Idh/MocA family oxidoreductase [Sphingomonas ginsenosidivorax]TXC70271.1 Gfo/Idh/MocA family oxidoreductase [Sphingomonas ginsenosidivorax]